MRLIIGTSSPCCRDPTEHTVKWGRPTEYVKEQKGITPPRIDETENILLWNSADHKGHWFDQVLLRLPFCSERSPSKHGWWLAVEAGGDTHRGPAPPHSLVGLWTFITYPLSHGCSVGPQDELAEINYWGPPFDVSPDLIDFANLW